MDKWYWDKMRNQKNLVCPRCAGESLVTMAMYFVCQRREIEMDFFCADCEDNRRDPYFTVYFTLLPNRIFDRQHQIEWVDGRPIKLVED